MGHINSDDEGLGLGLSIKVTVIVLIRSRGLIELQLEFRSEYNVQLSVLLRFRVIVSCG